MKRSILYVFAILLFAGVAIGQSGGAGNGFTPLPAPMAGEAVATFGGGCFWSMSEAMSELKGVNKVISGYAGGTTKNPTYDQVTTPDVGTDYRSLVFYRTPEEKDILLGLIKKINKSKYYPEAIVTQVVPFTTFYVAENYHQGYYRLNGDKPYIVQVSRPKVMKFRKVMNAKLKPEFQK